jgi:hypothetical protein
MAEENKTKSTTGERQTYYLICALDNASGGSDDLYPPQEALLRRTGSPFAGNLLRRDKPGAALMGKKNKTQLIRNGVLFLEAGGGGRDVESERQMRPELLTCNWQDDFPGFTLSLRSLRVW